MANCDYFLCIYWFSVFSWYITKWPFGHDGLRLVQWKYCELAFRKLWVRIIIAFPAVALRAVLGVSSPSAGEYGRTQSSLNLKPLQANALIAMNRLFVQFQ
jgi:hypothetical protein